MELKRGRKTGRASEQAGEREKIAGKHANGFKVKVTRLLVGSARASLRSRKCGDVEITGARVCVR